jgi:hypothetical protein
MYEKFPTYGRKLLNCPSEENQKLKNAKQFQGS